MCCVWMVGNLSLTNRWSKNLPAAFSAICCAHVLSYAPRVKWPAALLDKLFDHLFEIKEEFPGMNIYPLTLATDSLISKPHV